MLYLTLFGCGLLGWATHALLKAKGIQDKARLANVEFKFWEYFTKDFISHGISFLGIILFLVIIDELHFVVGNYPKILSITVGYMGSDIIARFFSVVNKKVNAAIDFKSTIADTNTGTLGKPTPK